MVVPGAIGGYNMFIHRGQSPGIWHACSAVIGGDGTQFQGSQQEERMTCSSCWVSDREFHGAVCVMLVRQWLYG